MTSQDIVGFTDTFTGLLRMLAGRKIDDTEKQQMVGDYFRALRAFPLSAVRVGAEVVAQRAKHFPKPAEWIECIPRAVETDLPMMLAADAREWARARSLGWEDEPCACDQCTHFGASHLPLRYVPMLDRDDRVLRMRNPFTGRTLDAGYWAHGDELRGFYRARGAFYAFFETVSPGGARVLRALETQEVR